MIFSPDNGFLCVLMGCFSRCVCVLCSFPLQRRSSMHLYKSCRPKQLLQPVDYQMMSKKVVAASSPAVSAAKLELFQRASELRG